MIRIVLATLALLAGAVSASAQPATREVVVLTSFPKELFEACLLYTSPSPRD